MKSRFFFFGNEGIPVIFYLTRLIPLNTCTPTHTWSGQSRGGELNITRPWGSQVLDNISWKYCDPLIYICGNLEILKTSEILTMFLGLVFYCLFFMKVIIVVVLCLIFCLDLYFYFSSYLLLEISFFFSNISNLVVYSFVTLPPIICFTKISWGNYFFGKYC